MAKHLNLFPGERDVETVTSGEAVPTNYRTYMGVRCTTCGAEPGRWCQRVTPSQTITILRSLHMARRHRMAALDAQGWDRG